MRQKLLRLTAMLMFSCVMVSSIPSELVQAEESTQTDSSISTTQSTEQSGTDNSDNSTEQSDVSGGTGDNTASEDSAADADETDIQNNATEESETEETEQSQEDSIIEKNAHEINYVFVESPYLETPGTERIAVSYGDGTENVSDVTLTVRNDDGEDTVWDLSVSADQVYLFTYDFSDESSSGTYEVVSFNVTDEEGEKSIQLSDSGMEAYFGVNEEYDGIEELTPLDVEDSETESVEDSASVGATVAEIDPNNVEESTENIVNALQEAETQTDTSDVSASLETGSSISGITASKSASVSVDSLVASLGAQIQTLVAANTTSSSGNIVVALDPGHDSTHTGASSNGLKEEELTLKIAQYCKAELETYSGVTVYMTRTTASCPYPSSSSSGDDISKRVAAAVKAGASIFVSFHLNSSTSSSAKGAEVIIPNSNWKPEVAQEGKALAQAILQELQAVGLSLRPTEIYSKNTTIGETYPDGSLSDYYAVQIYTKEAGIPGIIVEHAFLTNSEDRTYLDSEADLKALGVADATGIASYLGLSKDEWTAPKLIGAKASSNGTTISWNSVTGATGYAVYRKASGGTWSMIATTSSTNYTDTTKLTNGATYYYTVRAYKSSWSTASANKYDSKYWTSFDSSGEKAVYITVPVLKDSYENTTQGIKVSWNAVSGVSGYAVYRKTSGGSWGMIGTTTSTSYTDNTVSAGKEYSYTVRAYIGSVSTATANKYSASYWSGYSSQGISGSLLATPVLSGVSVSGNEKTISWKSVSGATGYAIYRKVEGGSWSMIDTTTSTKYVDKTALAVGKTYYYTVRAYRGNVNTAKANKYIGQYWSSYDSSGVRYVSLGIPVLNATKTASSGITVNWKSVSGASGYAVYRKTSGGSWAMIATTTSTTYTDKSGMSNGKVYYYTVRAYLGNLDTAKANKYSASYWSGYDKDGVKGCYISVPSLSKVTASAGGRTVSWNSVSGVTGYAVYRKIEGGSWGIIGTTKTTSYTDTSGMTSGKTYYYTVRAYSGDEKQALANKYSAAYWSSYNSTGLKCLYIGTPGLKETGTSASGITVNWNAVSGASGYAVYRKASGGSWAMIATTTSTTYTDKSGMSNGKEYYYTVRAYVGDVNTAKSNRYNALYWSGYDKDGVKGCYMSVPSLSKITASAGGRTVSWNSVSGVTGYAVYRKIEGGSWGMIGTTKTTSYTDTSGMTSGKTYYYTVRAYSGDEKQALANKYSAAYWSSYNSTGLKCLYIGTPVLKETGTSASGITVNWNAVSGASGYAVYRKTSGGSWAMIATTTSTTYTDKSGMSNGKEYYYTVRAYVGNVNTAKSNKYNALYWSGYDTSGKKGQYISIPSLSGTKVVNSGIQVSWNAVSGASGYAVYRKTSGGSWGLISYSSNLSYVDTSATANGTTYYYTVRAYVGNQSSANANKYSAAYWSYYNISGIQGSLYAIEGTPGVTVSQMVEMYNTYSPISYPKTQLAAGGASTIEEFAQIFYDEAVAEGIRPEVAWCQTMLETGYLKFGGDVKISQFNFAGLGATGNGAQGASFTDVRTGVRAQIQHLKAYASATVTESTLKNPLVDPRFQYVDKGCAKYVEILGIQENPDGKGWATSEGYGINIVNLIKKCKNI